MSLIRIIRPVVSVGVLAKELRPRGLQFWTFQSNVGARRFYERHGFEAVETTAGATEEWFPDLRYRSDP